MYIAYLLLAPLAAVMPPSGAEVRAREVPVALYGKEAAVVAELAAAEVEIKEDGKKRAVLGVRRDDRPADVALILDSSQYMGDDYRDILIPAATEFREALPSGSRLTIWTCGGRIVQNVPFGIEPEKAADALRMTPDGGPNFGLEALGDVATALGNEGGARRYVVLVSTTSIVGSKNLMDRAYRAIPEAVVTPVIVAVGSSGTLGGYRVGGEGRSWDVESVLEDMAVGYGGSYELILTTQAVSKIMAQVAAGIASEFLVRFESEADALMRPEVKVKRKNVEVLRTGFARLAR